MDEDRVVSLSNTLEDEDKRDVEGQENVQVKPGVFNTREKKLTLFCISLYWFIICCAYAMIAPFFPGEVSTVLWKIFVQLHRKLQKVYPGADLAGKISGAMAPGIRENTGGLEAEAPADFLVRRLEVSCSFLVHLSHSQVFSVNNIFEIQNFVPF